MKTFLTLLLAFYVLGCHKTSNDNSKVAKDGNDVGASDSDSNAGGGDDNTQAKDPTVFTITHKADEKGADTVKEVVIILLRDAQLQLSSLIAYDADNPSPYEVRPNECLKITASQFDRLIVLTGMGVGWNLTPTNNKVLCGRPGDKCQPKNYDIIDEGTLMVFDDYIMSPVSEPNTDKNCIGIEEWMKSKQPQATQKSSITNNQKVESSAQST